MDPRPESIGLTSRVRERTSVSANQSPAVERERFRGGLAFKAHIRVYHSTQGSRVTKKKKRVKSEQQ